MVHKGSQNSFLQESKSKRSGKSPSRSPTTNGVQHKSTHKPKDYTSEGVRDYDILNLPASDWQLLGVLTVIAAVVRLFKIYQPSSVVFDEVQYETSYPRC